MNIFYLDYDIKKCAKYHCDKHVVKMLLEYAQLLSSACHVSGSPQGYALTHKNHPCAIWTRASEDNFLYLADLAYYVHKEWQTRYHHTKNHKSWDVISNLDLPKLPSNGFSNPPKCMPDEYKVDCVVESYRNYYIGAKSHFATWKNGVPEWYQTSNE